MDSSSLLSRYDGILRTGIDHSNAGFFAYVTFVLNQVRYAEANRLLPVAYFGLSAGEGTNAFYEESRGDNTWDYWFEPVAGITDAEVRRRVDDPEDPLKSEHVTQLSHEQMAYLHASDPDSVYNYPYGHYRDLPDEECDAWYTRQRAKARRLLAQYVRPKPHIWDAVEEFWCERLKGAPVLGIHMRGSDKGSADSRPERMRVVFPEEYFPHVDRYLHEQPDARIFIATEQEQFIDMFHVRYGERVVVRDAIRTARIGPWTNPFQQQDGDGYRKGEEVLVDCLLLARSDFLVRCTSAVGEYAMYWNENLRCIDLNLQSPPEEL